MLACGLCREESRRDREEEQREQTNQVDECRMIKIFEVTEVRTYRALVKIEVPDDVQWQTADYERACDEEVRQTEMKEVESGTSYKESNVSVEEYDAGRVLNWNEWMQ